jgi:hypothetical protein
LSKIDKRECKTEIWKQGELKGWKDEKKENRHLEIVLENNVKTKEGHVEEWMKNQQNKDESLEKYAQELIDQKNKIFEIKIRSALMK